MRVLLVPEVYRPDDLTANGTVNDAVTWVERWLRVDERLHVYWLLPPRERSNYELADVCADRDRVTLVEARRFMADRDGGEMFTEGGYSEAELRALREAIFEPGGYVDVVVDQRRTGRFTLYKWLLAHVDQWAARVRPFDVVANVHDLQVPFKYRYCDYRNAYQMKIEQCAALFADGCWFKAGVDARELREHAREFLRPSVVDEALADAVDTGSPQDLTRYEEEYAEEPNRFHIAGSLWNKKHAEEIFAIGRALHERYGIETVMTSMEEIPAAYREPEWVEAHANASRETYERALRAGDVAVCASEYETMARTPFEQAASGQVLVLRDEPWVYDCVPEDHPLVVDADELAETVTWVVRNWSEAVAANRRLVEHVSRVRDPERCGRRTYEDLRRRVDAKARRYPSDDGVAVVARALDEFDGPVAVDELVERTARFTDDGVPLTERDSYAFVDLRYTLRALGYRDAGEPGTPVFERADAPESSEPGTERRTPAREARVREEEATR